MHDFITYTASTSPASIGKMPGSCADLRLIGHKKSGLFSVLGNRSVDSVYCDFTKDPNDTGMCTIHLNNPKPKRKIA